MTDAIHVCSLARLPEVSRRLGAGSLLTLLSPGGVTALRPASVPPERHHVVGVSDIVAPREGFTQPEEAHVAALLAFVRSWDRRTPLLVHCYAGVSRSTAAAYAGVCALSPDRDEAEVAAALRRLSPTATPNARIVALADGLLNRGGRMVRAIEAIGRGAECFEGEPFGLPLR